jgi:hypothetical protein
MGFVVLAAVVLVLGVAFGWIWRVQRREGPLRREVRAREISFRSGLVQVKQIGLPWWIDASNDDLPLNAPMELIVRGDGFEVSSTTWLARVLLGMEYCFRAREASLEVRHLVPRIYGMDPGEEWIVVSGRRANGKAIRLGISKKSGLRDVWAALVAAGAVPTSGGPSLRTG